MDGAHWPMPVAGAAGRLSAPEINECIFPNGGDEES